MTAKSIFLKAGLCALALAALSFWFAACASWGSKAASTGSAAGEAKQAASGAKAKTEERGLSVEELPQIKADIEVFPQLGHSSFKKDDVWMNSLFVVFSPNGTSIATVSSDTTVKLWDLTTGMEIKSLVHSSSVISGVFSCDGNIFVSYSSDGVVKLWDIAAGKEIKTFKNGRSGSVPLSVDISPDGKTIASISFYGYVMFWDIAAGKEIKTFRAHNDAYCCSVIFSPDGKTIATAGGDSTVKLWDVATGVEIKSFSTGHKWVNSFKFNPDGNIIALNGKLWDVATGNEIKTFTGYKENINSVNFNPNGTIIGIRTNIETSKNIYVIKGVTLWDITTGSEIQTISTSFSGGVDFSPDGKIFSISDNKSIVKLYNLESGMVIMTLTGHAIDVRAVAYSPDGKFIVSGDTDGTVILWDAVSGKKISTFISNTERSKLFSDKLTRFYVNSLAFSPDSNIIAAGLASYSSDGGRIILWDVNSGNRINVLINSNINSIMFSSDGKSIVSAHEDGSIQLWDISQRNTRIFSSRLDNRINHTINASISPDGKYIVAGSLTDNDVKLWEVESGRIKTTFSRYGNTVAYSPDGKTIAVTSADNRNGWHLILLDVTNGMEIIKLGSFPREYTQYINFVLFSPDGKTVAAVTGGSGKLWDVSSGREICTLYNVSRSIAFSPNSKQIVTASIDGTIRLLDIATDKEIAAFVSFTGEDPQLASASRGLTVETQTTATSNEGEWLSITPDGYYQASPRGDRYLNVRVNNTVSGIDSYRSIFYNPDVVQARLQGRPDPASKSNITIQQAAAFIPPEVAIQSPANFSTTNTATANLSVNITSQSQPVKNIKIIVNGRLIGKDELVAVKGTGLEPQKASLTVTGNQKTVNLSLPLEFDPGNNRIEVVAFNGYSESRRFIDVTRNAPAGEKPPLPNLWILAVGVNGYDNAGAKLQGLANLNFAVADAKGLVDSLKAQEGKRYAKVNSMLIADGEAQAPTTANIRQGLKFLEGADPRRDIVILFLAGHGISAQESKFFFLPKDAIFNGDRIVDANRAISGDEIMTVLDAPGNRLVFIDACQSGGVDNDRMVRSLMDTNAFVFTASRGNELSYESRELGHGFFTYSVMSALKGAPAALAQGNVSVLSMSGFVKDDVPKKTGGRQNPSAYSLGFYDFPVAVIK